MPPIASSDPTVLSPEVVETLKELTPGSHAVLIYDSPENKREVAFAHLAYGIRDSELAYVCSEETPQQVKQAMRESGIDVEGLERNGRLSVSHYDGIYLDRGQVHIPSIIAHFSRAARRSARQDLRGLRAVGEMSCFLRHNRIDELLEYERTLERRFSFPAMGVCAYNLLEMASTGKLEKLMPMLRAHETIILTGPKGSSVLKPEEVQKQNLERVMRVKV